MSGKVHDLDARNFKTACDTERESKGNTGFEGQCLLERRTGKKAGMYIILIDSLIITCIYSKLPNRIPMPILRNIPC